MYLIFLPLVVYVLGTIIWITLLVVNNGEKNKKISKLTRNLNKEAYARLKESNNKLLQDLYNTEKENAKLLGIINKKNNELLDKGQTDKDQPVK